MQNKYYILFFNNFAIDFDYSMWYIIFELKKDYKMKKKILGTIKLISAIALCSPAPISFISGVTCIAVAQNNMYNLYDNFIKAEANLDTDSQKYSSINKIKEPKKDDKEIVKEDKHKTIDLFDMSVYTNSIY